MSAAPFTFSIAIALLLMFFVLPLIIRNKAVTAKVGSLYAQESPVRLNTQKRQLESIKEEQRPNAITQTSKHDIASTAVSHDPHIHSGKIYTIEIRDEELEENSSVTSETIVCSTAYYVLVTDRADSIEAVKAHTS